MDPLESEELKILVVETAESLKLLQERDEHARVVLVRPGQVDVLEIEYQALAVAGAVHSPVGGTEKTARLSHLYTTGRRFTKKKAPEAVGASMRLFVMPFFDCR